MPISSDDWGREEMISHARDLSYYTLREMEASIATEISNLSLIHI